MKKIKWYLRSNQICDCLILRIFFFILCLMYVLCYRHVLPHAVETSTRMLLHVIKMIQSIMKYFSIRYGALLLL